MNAPPFRKTTEPYRWDAVPVHEYKQEGSAPFRDITRQTLFAEDGMAAELRYFEMAAGGHSTLERHEHMHAVMIFRGSGQALVGGDVRDVDTGDLVCIPPMTWHQLRANAGEPMGFLCMVDRARDKPQLPSEDDLWALTANASIAAFLAS